LRDCVDRCCAFQNCFWARVVNWWCNRYKSQKIVNPLCVCLKDERALIASLHLNFTKPDLDSNCLFSPRAPYGVVKNWLLVKWLWKSFKDTFSLVKSLSDPSMINVFKQIRMEMNSCIQSRAIFIFVMVSLTLVLISYEKHLCEFYQPRSGFWQV